MSHFMYCYALCLYAVCHYAESRILCIVMLNVFMLSVVAPFDIYIPLILGLTVAKLLKGRGRGI